MSQMGRGVAAATAVALLGIACTKVPFTGRQAFTAIPDASMNAMGADAYREQLSTAKVASGPDAVRLRSIGSRVAVAADKPEYAWEFSLLQDEMVNAWALPGGYIAFYTGILPVLRHEAGMAFVMGHEVGHAVARHSSERLTQSLGVAGALSLLDLVLSGSGRVTDEQRGLIVGALGLGAEVGITLPFSRAHETEADIIGLMYMADAGYPPRESIGVWERMNAVSGDGPPVFLSTHPSHSKRIATQEEWLPEAAKRFRRAQKAGTAMTTPLWER